MVEMCNCDQHALPTTLFLHTRFSFQQHKKRNAKKMSTIFVRLCYILVSYTLLHDNIKKEKDA